MKYGVAAATRPDSMWGQTTRWRCGRYGSPLAFGSMAGAQEAAKAFNDRRGPFDDIYDHAAALLEQEEAPQWTTEM